MTAEPAIEQLTPERARRPRSPSYAADKKAHGHRRARPARRGRLHRLLRASARATATARSRRSTTRIHIGLKNEHGLLPRRVEGLARVALDPHGLPRRRRPRLHAGDARVLPARAALGRGARARDGVGQPGHQRVVDLAVVESSSLMPRRAPPGAWSTAAWPGPSSARPARGGRDRSAPRGRRPRPAPSRRRGRAPGRARSRRPTASRGRHPSARAGAAPCRDERARELRPRRDLRRGDRRVARQVDRHASTSRSRCTRSEAFHSPWTGIGLVVR